MTRGKTRAVACPLLALTLALGAAACGELPDPDTTEGAPIFGGVSDPADEAVMALVHQMGLTGSNACTGTTIAKVGASAIFLTAGHCVVETDGMGHIVSPLKVADPSELYIIPGPDWAANLKAGLYYGATAVMAHPQYDGNVQSPFDLALIRFVGVGAATPVIPAISPADDAKLALGSAFTIVGFGKTETNDMNSQRRKVDRVISSINSNQFLYDQTDAKGACQGDSGGPSLVSTANGPRVAGVTSFGDADCTKLGVSVRAGPAAALIQSFVDGTPASLACGDCTLAAVAPGNQCVNQGITCGTRTTPCGKFVSCANACTTQACVTSCQNAQPAGATAYDAMVTCQCGGACAAACRTNQACAPYLTGVVTTMCGGVSDPRPACLECLQGSCCNEAAACAADATCSECLVQSSSGCRLSTAFANLSSCKAACAGAPCSATAPPPKSTGCGCDAAPAPGPRALAVALLAAAVALGRRRRVKRAARPPGPSASR